MGAAEILELRDDLKSRAKVDSAPPSRIMLNAGVSVSSNIQARISRNAQAQIIKRARHHSASDPRSLKDVKIPDSLAVTADGGRFYHGCVETESGDRAFIFTAEPDLRRMARAKYWSADGTFNVSKLLSQLLTIHCSVDPSHSTTIPAVYILMSSKTEELYVAVLEEVTAIAEEYGITLKGTKIYTDFEKALINAFEAVFPDGEVVGCFFHFAQALFRKIGRLGLMRKVEKKVLFRQYDLVKALAFMPAEDIPEAFAQLQSTAPPAMAEWMQYVAETWVTGKPIGKNGRRGKPLFPPELWSIYKKVKVDLPRNNNNQESWHARVSRLVDIKKVSLFRMIEFLQKEQKDVQGRVHRALGMQPNQSKPANKQKNEQLSAIVENYHRYSVVDYLSAIAGILHGY